MCILAHIIYVINNLVFRLPTIIITRHFSHIYYYYYLNITCKNYVVFINDKYITINHKIYPFTPKYFSIALQYYD